MSAITHVNEFSCDEELILSLTPSQKKVLYLIVDGYRRFGGKYYQSKSGISELLKISERTVYRAIDRLLEMGLIFEKWFGNVIIRTPKKSLISTFCQVNVRKEKNIPLYKRNDNDAQALDDVQSTSFFHIAGSVLHDIPLSSRDTKILCCLAKKNPGAMQKAIDDYSIFSKSENVRNPVAYIISKWKKFNVPQTKEIAPEVAHLPISQEDKEILSSYNAKDRKSFLLAYEDFKSYSMIRNVGNAAALITSRFFAYLKGEGSKGRVSSEENKKFALEFESRAKASKGINICALNKYVEISSGVHCDVIEYDDDHFDQKLKKAIKKWGIEV